MNFMKQNTNRWLALLIVLTAPLLSVIDVFIINVAIPAIKKGVQASEAQVQLVIAGYLLGYAAFLITGGRFGDYFGKKKVFIYGMAFFTLTSCWCGLTHSAFELNTARFFQGVSAAFMVPQTISYIQVLFPLAQDRAKAVGYFGVTLGLASILGQFLGGYFAYFHFFIPGWRLIFFINLPIGILAVAAAAVFLEETKLDRSKKFDFTGVVLLTFALGFLILPLVTGRENGWPWWSWLMLVFSFFLFFLFAKNQKKRKKLDNGELIDTGLFAFRDFNIGLLSVFCLFMVHNSYLLISTLLFQNGYHLDAFLVGKLFILFGLGSTFTNLYAGKLFSKYGKKVAFYGVASLMVSLALQLFLFSSPGISLWFIGGVLILHGIGTGILITSILNITLQSVPKEFAGAASGLYSTFQQTSSALGVSLIGGLFFSILAGAADLIVYQKAFRYGAGAELLVLLVLGILLYMLPKASKAALHYAE
ncbi:MFS transporter [Flavobacterium sp. LC2016-01]|uniref:MFS transporter n=1 Tax=Flavobacterium sp. LC2016-01 TaxID=2675876 RepID=UPI0012BABD9D|nr:MFS transporter [Flavobacterium sp. LC2016-01]MTH15841.1 MFS transporter [Flavobacterium sp. LC2016-01]